MYKIIINCRPFFGFFLFWLFWSIFIYFLLGGKFTNYRLRFIYEIS